MIDTYLYTNTCESLKQSIQWKNILWTYYVLKIERHTYLITYTNLELKIKYFYKNK